MILKVILFILGFLLGCLAFINLKSYAMSDDFSIDKLKVSSKYNKIIENRQNIQKITSKFKNPISGY